MIAVFRTLGSTKSQSPERPPGVRLFGAPGEDSGGRILQLDDNKRRTGLRVGGREGGDAGGR